MVFEDMTQALIKGDRVEIRGFVTFKMKAYKGYTGRNPKTGVKTEVKPKRLPFSRSAKNFGRELISSNPSREEK